MKKSPHLQQKQFFFRNDISARIVQALREAGPDYVSGIDLADRGGISRVAVWKRIQKLQEEGFAIASSKRKGYRLEREPENISALALLSYLPASMPLEGIWFTEESRSTNSDALELLARGETTPFLSLTKKQTMGRGRMGRSWYSKSNGNLYLSAAFQPLCHPRKIQLLSLWCGIRLCRSLRQSTGLPIAIKWPNDLWIEGKKVAGILSEATYESDRVNGLVLGIGLNINTQYQEFPKEIQKTASSLYLSSDNRKYPLNRIAAEVAREVLSAYQDCMNGLNEDTLSDLWSEYACFLGETVQIISPSNEIQVGKFTGIDRSGSLLLRTPSGKLLSFRSGDVSLRPRHL